MNAGVSRFCPASGPLAHSGAMRAIWNGSLSFGLVNIPVRLYSASKERALSFRLIDKKTHSPVRYKKVNDSGREVEQADIVKGYEVSKGEYIILGPEDFKRAAPRKQETIDIVRFVDVGSIDPQYFDKPYYVEPAAKAAKAYALLRDALKATTKAAIAQYVFHEREHIGLLRAEGDIIELLQLRYQDELRDPGDLAIPDAKYEKRELQLAESLIEELSGAFKPSEFKDTYAQSLHKVIEAKARGKPIKVKEKEAPEATSAADILKALQKSLRSKPEPLSKQSRGTKRIRKKA